VGANCLPLRLRHLHRDSGGRVRRAAGVAGPSAAASWSGSGTGNHHQGANMLPYRIWIAAIVLLAIGCDSSSRNAGEAPAERQQAVISREPVSSQPGNRTRAGADG